MNDLVFANAVSGSHRLQQEALNKSKYFGLKEHLRLGIYDRHPWETKNVFEERAMRYAAGGDAMLLQHLESLVEKVHLDHS